MKTIMKTFTIISVASISMGALFKIMHYPGAGILLLVGFALLAFPVYPITIYQLRKTQTRKGIDYIFISSIIGGDFLIMSVLFKIMHYPGSNLFWLFGFFVFVVIVIPSIMIFKIVEKKAALELVSIVVGSISLIIALSGLCFNLLHWPSADILLIVGSVLLSLVWLPLYAYQEYKFKQNLRGSFIFVVTGLLIFNSLNLILALNVSRNVMEDFVQPAVTSNTAIALFEDYNTSLAEKILRNEISDSATIASVNFLTEETDKITGLIEATKAEIIMQCENINLNRAESMVDSYYNMQNTDEFEITHYLLFGNSGDGMGNRILQAILNYSEKISSLISSDTIESRFVANLLSQDVEGLNNYGEPFSWAEKKFGKNPAMVVLTTLSWIELNVLIAENSVLRSVSSVNSIK